MGDSRLVAMEHYLQVSDEEFQKAVDSKATRKMAHHSVDSSETGVKCGEQPSSKVSPNQDYSNPLRSVPSNPVGRAGLEAHNVTVIAANDLRNISNQGGAKCGALTVDLTEIAADLTLVVEQWNDLSEQAKSEILHIVRSNSDRWE